MRVTVLAVKGSAPREAGAAMLVTPEGIMGSIGGGRLEHGAEATARALLSATDDRRQFTELQGLGPDLEQCCGGAVTLLYQRFEPGDRAALAAAIETGEPLLWRCDAGQPQYLAATTGDARSAALSAAVGDCRRDGGPRFLEQADGSWLVTASGTRHPELCLFGAGHVGAALVPLLAALPLRVHWYDERAERLPQPPPAHVLETRSDDPLELVHGAGDDALFLVMTHSHPLDEEICFAVLSRERFGWLGLIGSRSKRARFVHRLARRGIAPDRLERLQCPVGLPAVRGKRPATIALSIAAQLLAEHVPAALR